eukprot:scaffold25992_cov135-Isochrysis_galbana.AAC.1
MVSPSPADARALQPRRASARSPAAPQLPAQCAAAACEPAAAGLPACQDGDKWGRGERVTGQLGTDVLRRVAPKEQRCI